MSIKSDRLKAKRATRLAELEENHADDLYIMMKGSSKVAMSAELAQQKFDAVTRIYSAYNLELKSPNFQGKDETLICKCNSCGNKRVKLSWADFQRGFACKSCPL